MNKTERACRTFVIGLAFLAALLVMPRIEAKAATANEKTAFSFFTDTMGLSPAAACGVMSNIKCESGFSADINGLGGAYGICQWTGVRKSRLQSWCSSKGYSASSLNGQLRYLQYELKTYFPKVNNYLKSVSNTASGAYNAAFYFCYYFEAPANTYSTSVYRGNLAKSTYWSSMGASTTYVTAAAAGTGIKLTWNGSSKYSYEVKRVTSSGGTYSTIATIAAGAKRTYTDKSVTKGKKYYYYILPTNASGKALSKSNKVSCSAKPSMQDSVCSIKLAKTEYTYTGKALKPKVTVSYDGTTLKVGTHYTVTYSNNKNAGTATLRVTGKGKYTGTVKLNFTIAKAEQTVKASSITSVLKSSAVSVKASAKGNISLTSADTSIAVVKNGKLLLKKPGVTQITVKAAATKNYKAASKTITLTVKPAKPVISSAANSASGTIVLKWKKASSLTGYQVQYTTSSKFNSSAKSVLVEGESSSCTIQGLTKGKTYRFRVRSYKTIEDKKLYSKWSPVKTLKLKK